MNYDLNDILERADPEELADRNIAEICDLVETLTHIVNNQQYTIEQQLPLLAALVSVVNLNLLDVASEPLAPFWRWLCRNTFICSSASPF